MELTGILFDWDGVIIDSAAAHEVSWEMLAAETGKPLPEGHFKAGFGKTNAVIIPSLGWSDEPSEIARLAFRKEELYREVVRREGVTVLPGVRQLLEELRLKGIRCAIASSTPRINLDTILEITKLGPYFDAIVSGDDVKHGKPDPEVFQKAAAKLQSPVKSSLVFEDAFVGIEAAKRAGMKVVGVATTNPVESLANEADWVVHNLEEVSVADLQSLIQTR